MSFLVEKFIFIFFTIFVVFLYIIIFKSTPSLYHENTIFHASNLTKLPGVSFSNTYIENPILEYSDYSNDFYHGIKKNNYTGFVYAK